MVTLLLLLGAAFVLALIPLGLLVARAYVKARGPRAIVCPETRTPEVVAVDAARTAWTSVVDEADYRLTSCSRWPEREACGQECLAQIESAPDGCLVRERLAKWYEGTICAICRKPIGEIRWSGHKPALLGPDRQIRGWGEVPVEELPEALGTHWPLCWDCQVLGTFRARFPEPIVERHRLAPESKPARPGASA
jgi:hypothetical protein